MTVEGNGTENYQLVVEEGQNVVQNAATITHRPLYLTSANAEQCLSLWTEFKNGD